jgi:ABC-type uncharacterized transport system permease subunit
VTPVSELEDDSYGPIERRPLRTRMLQGAGIIAFMCVFTVFGRASDSELTFGQRLMVIPLASLGGAVSGAMYFATDSLRARRGWRRTVANVLSLLAYVVATVAFLGAWVLLTAD